MKYFSSPLRAAAVALAGAFVLSGCVTASTVSQSAPAPYQGPATASGPTLTEQLRAKKPDVKPDVVFAIGKCDDETGQLKDAEAQRYSRAVTQGCRTMLRNIVGGAGFGVAERDPYNMALIEKEYQMSNQFMVVKDENGNEVTKQVGLIQRGGPKGGIEGADYVVTGSITTYSSSVATTGGGIDRDGIGASMRQSESKVGITISIVDVSTSLQVSSLYVTTSVKGSTANFHLTRIIGDLASTLVSVAGGTTSSTVSRPLSDLGIVSAEFGGARQLPVDFAVYDSIMASFARQVEANPLLFYQKPVLFDYTVPAN